MAGTNNTLQIKPVAMETMVQPQHLAVAIPLATLQDFVLLSSDQNAPHFKQAQQPTAANQAYFGVDGNYYYQPQIRLRQRTIPIPGPDVHFFKNATGKVRLEFVLEEAPTPGIPANAIPLNVRVTQVVLMWGSQQRAFDQPTLTYNNQSDPAQSKFSIHVGADLVAGEVDTLYQALSASPDAHLVVTLAYSYWIDLPPIIIDPAPTPTPVPPPTPVVHHPLPTDPEDPPAHFHKPGFGGGPEDRPLPLAFMSPQRADGGIPAGERSADAGLLHATGTGGVSNLQSTSTTPTIMRSITPVITEQFRTANWQAEVIDQARLRYQQPNFQTVTFSQSIPFFFDKNLSQNVPIYADITVDTSLSQDWHTADYGTVSRAPFPNTVYRLPDEIRLAYNAELGAPYMLPSLYTKDEATGQMGVRVVLRAAPWHDPEKLVRMRDNLYIASAGVLVDPAVVVAGFQSATLKLTTAFPEGISLMGGDGTINSLESGFDILLDLSLEYYLFLTQLMTTSIGLTGVVAVTLPAPQMPAGATASTTPAASQVVGVPMRLTFEALANLPWTLQIDPQKVSPDALTIVNQAQTDITIGKCEPRLLLVDSNSILPLAFFQATPTTPFPVHLATNGTQLVGVTPDDQHKNQPWNAIHVELVDVQLVQDPKDVLKHIHQVAPSGTLQWKIAVECPPFEQTPLPPALSSLIGVEVEISRTGFTPQKLSLKSGQASGQVVLQHTLQDVLSSDAGSILSFDYRVRNNYTTFQGEWSALKSDEGNSLVVYPNPIEKPPGS